MNTIGRKAYFKFGDNVVAVEILAAAVIKAKHLMSIFLMPVSEVRNVN